MTSASAPEQPPRIAAVSPAPRRRTLWIGVAATMVLGAVAAIVVALTSSEHTASTGASSAQLVAQRYVAAINRGDKDAAAAASCPAYRDQARAEAVSGTDPGITFTLEAVRVGDNATSATAGLREQLRFADNTQRVRHTLSVQRRDGRWLVCGRR